MAYTGPDGLMMKDQSDTPLISSPFYFGEDQTIIISEITGSELIILVYMVYPVQDLLVTVYFIHILAILAHMTDPFERMCDFHSTLFEFILKNILHSK